VTVSRTAKEDPVVKANVSVDNPNAVAVESLRRAKQGSLWAGAGRLMGIGAFAVLGWTASSENDVSSVPLRLVALVVFYAGLSFYNRGKRMQSMPPQALLALDHRPPVLYLRAFKDDKAAAERPLSRLLGFIVVFFGVPTEEEQLAEAMNDIGPMIAIGKPGEKLPELGASRIYVSDADWQSQVRALMAGARLVVLRAANTDGFWWEMKQAPKYIAPERVMFLLPFKKDEYEKFCKRAHGLLPRSLPDYEGAANLVGSQLRAMLYFDRDWTPHIQKLRVPFSFSLTPLISALKKAMRPMIERMPAEERSTPARRRNGFAWLRTIPAVLFLSVGISALAAGANATRVSWAVAANDRGAFLYDQRNFDGALAEFNRALRWKPDLVSALSNVGQIWLDKGDVQRAQDEFEKGLRHNPNSAVLHNGVGLVLLKKRDRAGAIAAFQRAAHLEPALAAPHENLCQVLSEQNNVDETASACRDALRVNPSSANAHYLLGNLARLQSDYAAAIDHYRDAIRLFPLSSLAHNNIGWTLAKTGKIDEAILEYREAIRLEPNSSLVHGNLGDALLAKRDWAGAATEFTAALRSSPNEPSLHYNLAFALNKQGMYAAARNELVIAYKLAPNDPTIRRAYMEIVRR